MDFMIGKCPCCSGKSYFECCGRFIDGQQIPATPEELMRSRYTAYSEANIDYVMRTMKGPAAKDFDVETTTEWAKRVKFAKLDVKKSSVKKEKATVEFIAHFTENGESRAIHEISDFRKENGIWFYFDGKKPPRR